MEVPKILPLEENIIEQARKAAAEQSAAASPEEERFLLARSRELLKKSNAVLVAHYYTAPQLQKLAEETGGCVADSLEMARFGRDHPAPTLVVAGVRFMGETAKILSPGKRVLMPDPGATCSLDLNCPADRFREFRRAHPDATAVVYANTSAAVKAMADWVVTSAIALPVVTHLAGRGERILWAPDRHLGSYIRRRTGVDMLIWPGSCIVHERFRAEAILNLQKHHAGSRILVHPESPAEVIAVADAVGSTSALIKAAATMDADTFIVATEPGIFHKMKQAAPGKSFLAAPTVGAGATCESCQRCPWMAMNGLRNLVRVLEKCDNEIQVPEATGEQAARALQRMLDFASQRKSTPPRGV